MTEYTLRIKLESDTCFSCGEGTAGLVDQEILHDEDGCPLIPGRTLKGLLTEEAANIVFLADDPLKKALRNSYNNMFGRPGSSGKDTGVLHIGNAGLPRTIRKSLGNLSRTEILESLTDVRRQTSVNYMTNAPKNHTLRSMRVLVRGVILDAPICFSEKPPQEDIMLLSLSASLTRRGGVNRNRGMGRINCSLIDSQGVDLHDTASSEFRKLLQGGVS